MGFPLIGNWLARRQESRAAALSRRDPFHIGDRMSGLFQWSNPGFPVAKVKIDEQTALTIPAVYASVRCISRDIGKLTINVFELHGEKGTKRKRTDLPLYDLLDVEPNDEMGSMDIISVLIAQGLLYGNGYAEIQRGAGGRPIALWPIHNQDIEPRRDMAGKLYYEYRGTTPIPAADIIHLKGVLAHSGILGEMTTRLAKDSYGLAKAAELYGASFFGNGARPGLLITHPQKMSPEQKKEFLDGMKAIHGGASNGNTNGMMPEGFKVEKLDAKNNEFQFLETRMFQIEEVCRWTGLPPHKLSHLVKSSFNTNEGMALDYVHNTLSPWVRQLEGEFRRKLLTKPQRAVYDIKFDQRELLVKDAKTQMEIWAMAKQNGLMCDDEIREEMDLNPLPGNMGNRFYVSLNYRPVDEKTGEPQDSTPPIDPAAVKPAAPQPQPQEEEQEEEPEKGADVRSLVAAFRPTIEGEVGRLLRVEQDKAIRAANKGEVASLVSTFYAKHPEHVRSSLSRSVAPLAGVLRAVGVSADLDAAVRSISERMVADSISDLADADGLAQRVEMWAEVRTPMIVDQLVSAIVDRAKATGS